MITLRTVENRVRGSEHLFGDGARRPMLVVLDADTVPLEGRGMNDLVLLAGLLAEDEIEVYNFSDRGVPESAPRLDTEWWGSSPIGWLQVTRDEGPDALRTHGLRWSDGKVIHDAAVGGEIVPAIAMAVARARGEEQKFEGTPDALLVAAAAEIEADILITRRNGLHSLSASFMRGLTIVNVADALSLLGLFLRSRGKYHRVKTPQFTLKSSKTRFFQESALLFLPDQLEVLDRSSGLSAARSEPDAAGLAAASFRRISRSIERRDQIWRLIDQPQNVDAAEDMLAVFEALLTSLMGAIDATARLAHVVYGLPGKLHLVGLQKRQWSDELKGAAPQLWDSVYNRTSHLAALTVLRLLRNTVHAEGLESLAVQESSRLVSTWIRIPRRDGRAIADAASVIAPLNDWGIQRLDTGTFLANPGQLMERLLLSILAFLADMQAVLVADLRNLTKTPAPRRDLMLDAQAVATAHLAVLGLKDTSLE